MVVIQHELPHHFDLAANVLPEERVDQDSATVSQSNRQVMLSSPRGCLLPAGRLWVFALEYRPGRASPCHGPPVEGPMRSCRILLAVIALLLVPSLAAARGGGGGHGGGLGGGHHSSSSPHSGTHSNGHPSGGGHSRGPSAVHCPSDPSPRGISPKSRRPRPGPASQ